MATDFLLFFVVTVTITTLVTARSSVIYRKNAAVNCFLRWIFSLSCCCCGSSNRQFWSFTPKPEKSTESSVALIGDENIVDTGADRKNSQRHSSLLYRYLAVYLMATLSDWLQGPYVYALYSSYGYSQHAIAILFVAGFGSSMIFGSVVGSFADSQGRRCMVLVFAVVYTCSCITKHFKSFPILLLGRFFGGISTSLLFSIFDSWLIRSHALANLPSQYLGMSFASAQFGNSVIAILAGLLANKAADYRPLTLYDPSAADTKGIMSYVYVGGFLAPFDIAIVVLALCGCLSLTLWDENYGDQRKRDTKSSQSTNSLSDDAGPSNSTGESCLSGFSGAARVVWSNNEIRLAGIISSLFEGSMYVFVFMWTPAINTDDEEDPPFGFIFSTFMVCCMAGSSFFSVLTSEHSMFQIKTEAIGIGIFATSAILFGIMAMSTSTSLTFGCMNVFEVTVGMYFPTMGILKSQIVPECQRSAIYNIYRIPLNFIVLMSLLTDLTPSQSFGVCFLMLSLATFLQWKLMLQRSSGNNGSIWYVERPSVVDKEQDENIEIEAKTPLVNSV